jgi:hypothetical protein
VTFMFRTWIVAIALAGASGIEKPGSATTTATLCELAEHPEKFAGKMVAVHASEMGPRRTRSSGFWIDDFNQQPCSSWISVWVAYPDQVRPSPGFVLERNDDFNNFFAEISKGKNVQATYEGRFDAAYVWRDHKRVVVGEGKGYGKQHKYGGRIILYSISEVVARPEPRK